MSCNGCRVLRKGCSESCLLRPCLAAVEGSDAQGHATLFLAKFFGRAGLMGFISAVNESQRPALFQSLLYEACGRTINPVYGSAGLLWSGQWHLCESAVESVLRGGTPTSCFTLNGATPSPPSPTLRCSPSPLGPSTPGLPPSMPSSMPPSIPAPSPPSLSPSMSPTIMNMSRAASAGGSSAMTSFPFPMMDPSSAMAYWPLAMAPMANVSQHMAAMNGAASAAAAYQAASYHQQANCQMPSHLMANNAMLNNNMNMNMSMNMPISHIGSACQMWAAESAAAGGANGGVNCINRTQVPQVPQVGSQIQARQGFSNGGGNNCNVGDSATSTLDSCMGVQGSSPPLVAPVARRLTAQSGPFMPPVSPAPGHHHGQPDVAGMLFRSDLGLCIPDWAGRAAAEPASHSLLPLLS